MVSDVNNSSTTDLGDIITYTITVSNTGLTSVTLTDYDTLSAEEGTFIATLTLDFTSTGSTTTLTPTQNFFKYSARIDDSANGWSESPNGNWGDGYPNNQNWWPGNVNYYFNSGSGETAGTVGMVDGYNNTGGNTGDDTYHNNNYSETSRIRVRGNSGNYLKYFVWQQFKTSLQPNTKYTISMYAKAYSTTYVGDTFKFIFHDDAQNGQTGTWNNNWSTDFDNAQKSPDQVLELRWKRFSHTFTTDNMANLVRNGRAGFQPPYSGNYGMYVWGIQIEENPSPTPYVFTYDATYVPSATVTGTFDPRLTELGVGQLATYTVTYTLTQAALDVAKKLHNSAKFVGTFTTNSGITASVSDTSDDPNTAAANDDTITDLDNESAIEVTKTYVVDQGSDNLTNLGDVITWQVAMENKGQTSLSSFTFSDTLTRWDSSTASSSFSTIQPGSKNLLEHTNGMRYDWNNANSSAYYSGFSYYNNQFARWIPGNVNYYYSDSSGLNWSSYGLYAFPNIGFGKTSYRLSQGGNVSYAYNGNNNARYSYSSRLYSPQNDPDAWVYQTRTLEANTTYTYSVYARAYSDNASGAGDQSTTTSDTFRFAIQDVHNPDGNNYVTRFNQAFKSGEEQLTDKFKRYSFTFTTSSTAGSTWVGIHPPYGSDASGGLFWGHQLEKRSSPSTYIYTYSGWDFNSPQVTLGEGYTQWGNNYPNTNAKPGNVYQYARIGSDWMMYNQNQNSNYYHIMEVESATVTAVTGYTQIGSGAYNGHTYWRSTGTGFWNTASQTTIPNISTSEIPAGVDKYLFVPNSQEEYNFIKNK